MIVVVEHNNTFAAPMGEETCDGQCTTVGFVGFVSAVA